MTSPSLLAVLPEASLQALGVLCKAFPRRPRDAAARGLFRRHRERLIKRAMEDVV